LRDRLLWRLLGAQLAVIVIAMAISSALITDLATRSFMTIMVRYHIEPAMVEADFLASTHRIMLTSTLIAAAVAMLLGWILVRRLVRPLEQMTVLAERIAEGDYDRRVDIRGPYEIARVAESLNQMVDGLRRVEALRRELVANVAHELRTPLATLQGYLEALRDGIAPPSHENLASLHEEVLRLVRLVDGLHQLSQFDARLSRLRAARFDLRSSIHRMVSIYGGEGVHRGPTMREQVDEFLPPIEADADLVSQALRNLVDNARRYASAGSDVTVAAALRGDVVRISVQNAGDEILPEDLPHIFERFYRGEKSRSRETGGAGIGLSLVQEIARAHGGSVGAESAGGLTTVWFELPVRPVSAVPAAARHPAAEKAQRVP
jgi:two-component system, OmpR family, sensor histidine kinase BaeS